MEREPIVENYFEGRIAYPVRRAPDKSVGFIENETCSRILLTRKSIDNLICKELFVDEATPADWVGETQNIMMVDITNALPANQAAKYLNKWNGEITN